MAIMGCLLAIFNKKKYERKKQLKKYSEDRTGGHGHRYTVIIIIMC